MKVAQRESLAAIPISESAASFTIKRNISHRMGVGSSRAAAKLVCLLLQGGHITTRCAIDLPLRAPFRIESPPRKTDGLARPDGTVQWVGVSVFDGEIGAF